MDGLIERALDTALRNWAAMAKPGEDAEGAANAFEASFYRLIDAVREWVGGLKKPPRTMEELLAMPTIAELLDRLPAPLHLNFETEAELILDGVIREEEDKYD